MPIGSVACSRPGQMVGVRQVDDHIWLVTLMHYDLGYFHDEPCRLKPIDIPFRGQGVTHVSGMNCPPCVRNGPWEKWRRRPDLNRG